MCARERGNGKYKRAICHDGHGVERIEGQGERLEKARRLVQEGKVHPLTPDGSMWAVDSESDPEHRYLVTAEGCSCPDYEYRHDEFEICKHMLAVELTKAHRNN